MFHVRFMSIGLRFRSMMARDNLEDKKELFKATWLAWGKMLTRMTKNVTISYRKN